MRRAVIVGGAPIDDYENVRAQFREDDYFIYCDCGLRHMDGLLKKPDLIIGDFDSHENPNMDVETIVLPHEKDDTDTYFAAFEAKKRGFEEVLLAGAVGKRFDHSLANIYILFQLDTLGIKASLVDDYSLMEVVSDETAYIEDIYPYFSLVNMTGEAKGITIRHAMYCLEDAEIGSDYQYGISNEVIKGETAEVSVRDGRLLLIKIIKE